MKPTSTFIRFLFSVFLPVFTYTINALPEESVSQKPQISQENKSKKLSEKVIKQVYTYINQIACIFGDLATLVQEDAIKIKDKEAKTTLNHEIISTRKTITMIAKDLDNSPTLTQLHTTLTLLKQLIAHLESYLKADFTQYKAFDIEENRTRLVVIDPATLTEESLLSNLTEAENKLKTIQKKADDTGLYWYNHFYRNFVDRPIIRPCEKYNLHWKGLYTVAAIASAAYVWYKFSDSTAGCEVIEKSFAHETISNLSLMEKICAIPGNIVAMPGKIIDTCKHYSNWNNTHAKINGTIRNWMGWSPQGQISARELQLINKISEHDSNFAREQLGVNGPIKLFGRIEKAALDIVAGHWYLGSALLWQPFREGIAETYKEYSGKLKNKALGLHNWLKGGAYYQRHKNKKGTFGRIDPRYVFDDIIGLEHAKEILGNIVKYMKDPESYDRAGLAPAKGYLLYGPTRTGKTMLAEALAGEIQKVLGYSSEKFPFFVIESRWISKEGSFDFVMRIIKEQAPCVIFIDEIDMLNLHRDKFQDKTEKNLLGEFLSTLSGCMSADPDKQVIILAATNRKQHLDESLQSRFGEKVPFEYPSFINRAQYFAHALEGKGLPIEQFDLRKLAEQTEGRSFEDLHKVINDAQFTTRDQGRPITQADIEKSLNTKLHGIIYQNYIELPEDDQHILAVHMAGHAIAYTVTEDTGIRMSQVTIRPVRTGKIEKDSVLAECLKDAELPNIMYGHVFTHHKADSLKFISQTDIERLCMIELAGHIAEKLIFGSHHNAKNTCSHHDTTKAFYWARKYQLNGLDEQLIAKSTSMQDEVTRKAYVFMQACEDKMRALLETRIELIKLVAEALKGFGTIGGEDMQSLIDLHKMLNGKTIEEFVKEMQESSAKEAADEKESSEISSTVRNELGIDEILPTQAEDTAAAAA